MPWLVRVWFRSLFVLMHSLPDRRVVHSLCPCWSSGSLFIWVHSLPDRPEVNVDGVLHVRSLE